MAQARQQLLLQETGRGSPEEGDVQALEETENEETTRRATLMPWIGRIAMFTVGCALLAALWLFDTQRGLPAGTTEQTVQLSDASISSEACEDMLDWLITLQLLNRIGPCIPERRRGCFRHEGLPNQWDLDRGLFPRGEEPLLVLSS